MARHKNIQWDLPSSGADGLNWQHATVAVLMDIRAELQHINGKLDCYRIPIALDALRDLGKDLRRQDRARRAKNKKARSK